MASKGVYIYELSQKVDALCEVMAAASRIKGSSRPKLALFSEINPHTLKSLCANRKSTISLEIQEKLAIACDFDPGSSIWNDVSIPEREKRASNLTYRGRDTALNFRKMVFKRWGLGSTVRLRLEGSRPITLDPDLASFLISDLEQAASAEEPINAFFHLYISPAYSECGKYAYGFRSINIRLMLSPEDEKKVQKRAGYRAVVEISGANLEARGNEFEPFWVLRAATGTLSGEYYPRDAPLCQLINHEVGDKFEAILYVHRTDEYLKRVDGDTLSSQAKKAVISSLMAKKTGIIDGTSSLSAPSSQVRLSSQVINIVASSEDDQI